jgi:AcrR family transcriptional regulator
MKSTTADTIIEVSIPLLAGNGYAGTSMRDVAVAAGIKPSVIYHYFEDKADLMRAVRKHINTKLDDAMGQLPPVAGARALLRQRLRYQIDNIGHIVALLQYFMAVKVDFPFSEGGYVPGRAYRHMREVIEMGVAEEIYESYNIDFDAKSVTHMVNGFLMEYYPHELPAQMVDTLVESIAGFIERALGYRGNA